MTEKKKISEDTAALRQRAEDKLKSPSLEMQNEALRAAQAELEKSRSRYFDLYDLAPVGYCTLSEQGLILEANPMAVTLLGTARSALIKQPISRFIFNEDQDIYYLHRKQLFETGEPQKCDLRLVKPDGAHFWAHLKATTAQAEDCAPLCRMTLSDITERKHAETLQAQLTQAQKLESVGRLAGGVAHDFNNMLGVILGHTELAMLRTDKDHDLYSDLKEIRTAAKRSADITKQLLAFARKQTISPRRLDLNDTVESILNMLRRLIGEEIDLVWKPAPNLWSVKMDTSQIDQILANLCVNAKDAIAGVGRLTIETGRQAFDEEYCSGHPGFIPGEFVQLAVSDNGCGMDKDTLENLFEPFFTTKEVGKGTGLGLATVYGIVRQNNGFINVYSEPGQGSTFRIYLPRMMLEKTLGGIDDE